MHKRWDGVTRKVVRDDLGVKMGRVVPDEMSWYETVFGTNQFRSFESD